MMNRKYLDQIMKLKIDQFVYQFHMEVYISSNLIIFLKQFIKLEIISKN